MKLKLNRTGHLWTGNGVVSQECFFHFSNGAPISAGDVYGGGMGVITLLQGGQALVGDRRKDKTRHMETDGTH